MAVNMFSGMGYKRAALLLYLLVTSIALLSMADYGMSWDEWFRWRGGAEKLHYYKMLVSGQEADPNSATPNGNAYPGLFDLSVALLDELTGLGLLLCGHMLSLFMGLAGLAAVWAIAHHIGGARAGFWALLFAAMMPRYYGHMFFNPKDIPFAATYLWGLYTLVRFAPGYPNPGWRAVIITGVAIGLCTASRVGGVILYAYVLLLFVLTFGYWLAYEKRSINQSCSVFMHAALKLFAMGWIIWLTVLPWWPYAQHNPINAYIEALIKTGEFPWNGRVLYLGQNYLANELPWHYAIVWLSITVPIATILLLLIGILFAIKRSSWAVYSRKTVLKYGVIIFATLFPVAYVMFTDATLYDGIRHLLFILPLIALLTGLSMDRLLSYLDSHGRFASRLLIVACVLSYAFVGLRMMTLHPYQYLYFNEAFGGLASARGKMETDYWAVSYKEAVEGLNAYLKTLGDNAPDRPQVFIGHPRVTAEIYMPEHWQKLYRLKGADFAISTYRWNLDQQVPGKDLLIVKREGVPLCIVRDLRSIHPSKVTPEGHPR